MRDGQIFSIAIFTLISPAVAAEDNAGRDVPALPVIVISPELTPANPQEVPKTVATFSGRQLDAMGTGDTVNLQYDVPGLVFKTNSVLGQPYLRGVGSDLITSGAEASVATFVDGVYLPRATHAIQDFFDLDRIEVIKGPQGVHLGRNVVGGAISIHTHDPVPYRSAYADVLFGNYDKRQIRFVLNQPLNGPSLGFRLAGITTRRDGYSDNIFLGNDADDEDYNALRAKLRYHPSSRLDVMLSMEYGSENSSRGLGHHPDPVNGVNGGILLGGTVPGDRREITHNTPPTQEADTGRYITRLKWRPGDLEFVSTTAYITDDADITLDLDATDIDFANNFPGLTSRATSQEFRLSSHDARPLSWVSGVYLLHEDTDIWVDVRFPLASAINRGEGSADTRSVSAFGQLVYRFTDRLNARAGLRYTRDRRSVNVIQTITDPLGALGPAGTTVLTQREQQDWEAFTPEVGVEYALSRATLYYMTAARGFKAGGYNLTAVQPAFDPEYLWAYEAGIKTELASHRWLFNAALFRYDYDDMQLLTPPAGAPTGTFPMVINAAEACIQGLDIEARYRPAWNYGFSAGVALLDARFDRFVSQDPNNPTADPDHAGDPLPQAPKVNVNVSAHYSWPLEQGELTLRGGYRYQSEMYFNVYQDPAVRQSGYGLVNAGASYESRNGRWYVQVYGRNLTDKLYAQSMIRQDPLIGILRWWGAPRTIGLRMGYRI